MNKEQLAIENQNLVYDVFNKKIKKCNFTNINKEDIISSGFVGLAKSINGYDETKNSKFSTYAYKIIYSEMLQFIRKEMKHYNNTISFNTKISKDLELKDVLVDTKDYFDFLEINNYEKLNNKQKKVVNMKYNDYNNQEIGDELGVSREAIRIMIKQIKKIIGENNERN